MDSSVFAARSVIKTYRKPIWNNFVKALKAYELIKAGDKVAVCISGGKDSFLLGICLKELQKYSDLPFTLQFLCMDPGYNPQNRALIVQNADKLGFEINFFETDIFNTVFAENKGSPCYLCARMRRGFLYKEAQKLGCNKIALGHHFDDVVETVLMSMLYGAELKSMMPKLHSEHYDNMELIRPLYFVREADIIRWKNYNKLEFLDCACRFTEKKVQNVHTGARSEIKALVKTLEKSNPQSAANIMAATHRVHIGTMPGIFKNGKEINFLEEYDKIETGKLNLIEAQSELFDE